MKRNLSQGNRGGWRDIHVAWALIPALVLLGLAGWQLTRHATGVHAQAQSRIWLSTAKQLSATYRGSTRALRAIGGNPSALAMAAGDLDGDAVGDLAVGFPAPGGGLIAIHRGNIDAFAPQSDASFHAIERSEFPAPYLPQADVVEIPGRPDFLAQGDLIGQGGGALVAAARGGTSIYVLAKGASGKVELLQTLTTSGTITGMDAHRLSLGKYAQLAVGVRTSSGSQLLIYTGSNEGLIQTAAFALAGDATAFASGNLDSDGVPDLLVIAGGQPAILHGGSQTVETLSVPYTVVSAALGRFVHDRNPLLQIALMADDGSLHILAGDGFDPTPWTLQELQAKRRAQIARMKQHVQLPPAPQQSVAWKEVEADSAVGAGSAGARPLMFRTRISSNAQDDVMVLGAARLSLLTHPTSRVNEALQIDRSDLGANAAAAVAVRVNIDGRPGVVYMERGNNMPRVLMPLPDPTYIVNRTDDPVPPASVSSMCNGVANDCSLREAVLKANATPGTDTISIPAGTYTLSLARVSEPPGTATPEDARAGTLNVTDSVNISGAGQNTTIIQAGTLGVNEPGGPNGVDKVFSFNQDIQAFTDATVAVDNLTIRNGFNRGNESITDGWGGAFDCDTGSSGNASVTLTNVTLSNNTLTDGEGAGFAMFNTNAGTGTVTVTGSLIQNNVTNNANGNGGGIAMEDPANLTMSSTQVINNKSAEGGGGIFAIQSGAVAGKFNTLTLHNVTISNNTSAEEGGGIDCSAGLVLDQLSVISGNTAGADGGGIWFGGDIPGTNPGGISNVTITGNSATGTAGSGTGFGGGIKINTITTGNGFTMQYSRVSGNTAVAGKNLDFQGPSTAGITVTENWWGANSDPKAGVNPTIAVDTASGTPVLTYNPWIVLTLSPSSSATVKINQTLGLTADVAHDSNGSTAPLSGHLGVFTGLPVTFTAGSGGSITTAQPVDLNSGGSVTSTYQAGSAGATSSASATFDNFTVSTTIFVLQPPSMTKAFSPTTVTPNTASTLSFVLTNGNTIGIDANFTDALPTGMQVAPSPSVSNGCGGTVTANAGATSITYSNSSLAVGACTIKVNVVGTTDGVFSNSATLNSTAAGNAIAASANLTVINPPGVAKAFAPNSVLLGGVSLLSVTVSSSNSNLTLNSVSFTDSLPSGMVVAASNNLSTTCNGTAAAAGSTVSLTGASLAPGASCVVSANVQATSAGTLSNSVQASSANGGSGNTASATLTVVAPPTISKTFTSNSIPLNGSTALTFVLGNPAANTTALTGVGFTDTLPSGLTVTNATTTVCGGTLTVTAPATIQLANATIAVSGQCQFSLPVTGVAAGAYTNTTGAVTSTNGGTGLTASAGFTVVAPPSIAKSFGSGTIAVNTSTPLTFTITNPSGNTVSLTGVGFSDTLPSGLTAASATSSTCGGTLTVTSPVTIQLSGATIAANSQCQFSVAVTGASAGVYQNVTGAVTSTNGGTGNTATANLTVSSPATVTGVSSTAANGTYGVGATIPIVVSFSKAVTVTGTPVLALNSGGSAAYSSGSGTATLTFNYTVAAGQSTSGGHLDAASGSALTLNGGTIVDSTSIPANLTVPVGAAAASLASNKAIVIDTTAPVVVSYSVLFGSQSFNVIGSSRILPWDITGIRVVFSKPIAQADTASLSGVNVTGLSGLGTNTLTWSITPVAVGNLSTMLAGSGAHAITDSAGNGLTGGAGFSQSLRILWGDFNGDGIVNAQDLAAVNAARLSPYNIFADLNGDGVVDATDVNIARSRVGTTLP